MVESIDPAELVLHGVLLAGKNLGELSGCWECSRSSPIHLAISANVYTKIQQGVY